MPIALSLDFWTALACDRTRHSSAQLKVVVGGVHDRVHSLLGEVTLDHAYDRLADSPFRHAHTSSTRSSSWSAVAWPKPRTPMSEIAMEAQATP